MSDLLTHGRLQRWQAVASAAGGVIVAASLFAITPMEGRADFIVVAYCLAVSGYLVAAGRIEGRRQAVDRFFHALVVTAVAVSLLAIGAVLVYTAARGADALKADFFRNTMNGVGVRDTTGGAKHAIIGTIEQVLLASLLAVPAGLLVAIYTVEYGRGRLAIVLRSTIDVMTGVPSIVAGLFIYAFWVLGLHKGFSGFAAAMALTLLMLPIVVRSAEEMLRLVPATLREASYALGVPRWRTVLSVVLPSASAGITTGVMLAVARVTGETAPLLLTAFGNNGMNTNAFKGPQSALPLFVFQQAGSAFATSVARAWAGALTLIVVVLILTTIARLLTRRNRLAT